ncbi:MAG: sodium/solute symporter [Prolixibacteraceae bacterium]
MRIIKQGLKKCFPHFFLPSIFFVILFFPAITLNAGSVLKWIELPPLPPAPGQNVQFGLAGAFAGVHNDVFILAGGSNFPDDPPWNGGHKVWYDDIFVLQRDMRGEYRWLTNKTYRLPKALAYGVSVSTDRGLILIGGCDAEHCYNSVFRLKWDPITFSFETETLPSLPCSLAFMSGTLVGNTICIAGGQETMKGAKATHRFFTLNLLQEDNPDEFHWQEQPPWPGQPRILAVTAGLIKSNKGKFYLFSGRDIAPAMPTKLLTDAYCFDLCNSEWQQLPDISYKNKPCCVMAATAAFLNRKRILIFGGSDGKLDLETETLETKISYETDSVCKRVLSKKLKHLLTDHPGFSKNILSYNTDNNIWEDFGVLPTISHVTTSIVEWNNSLIIPSGEIRPGVRTPRVWKCSLPKDSPKKDDQKKTNEAYNSLTWSKLSEIPYSIGYKGTFAGIHGKAIIVAGGANVTSLKDSSAIVFHDSVAVYQMDDHNSYQLIKKSRLDHPCAFGTAVSTDFGVVCMGGRDADRLYSDVYALRWNAKLKILEKTDLPELPESCAYMSASVINDIIYLAGGINNIDPLKATQNFWRLDLSQGAKSHWEELMPWPGASRISNITISQNNGENDCIYVMGGYKPETNRDNKRSVKILQDVYEFNPVVFDSKKYDPKSGQYQGAISPWLKRADIPLETMTQNSIPVGQSHIFLFTGNNNQPLFYEEYLRESDAGNQNILAYHTITDTWVNKGKNPFNYIIASTMPFEHSFVFLGEKENSSGTNIQLTRLEILESKTPFGTINFVVLAIYLLMMFAIGVYFFFQNKDTNDFFRGGQRVPWFAAACSIFATMLSSITFIAIPAKSYATDWTFMVLNFFVFFIAFFVIYFILPFFRKIDATSAYEYLEKRFNLPIRLFSSASFILFHTGRMAIVMYLPSLALATITPLSVSQCILIMGLWSIIYCSMGGLKAVIWTDTIQTFILFGGAIFSMIVIILSLEGGWNEFFSVALANHKFKIINWNWSSVSFTTTAFWVIILGGIGENIIPYTSDQAIVQRYMSVSSDKRAKKSILTNGIISAFPASILFFGIGTALFVFYKTHPQELNPKFQTDAIFPLFISRELPVGIAGLVVAGIFAAAQSTISTSMNSISTTLVTDFVRRFDILKSEKAYLLLARGITILFGFLGTGLALFFVSSNILSLWDKFMEILGLFGGAMCGLFLLGIFSRRANGAGAIAGAFVSVTGLFLVQQYTKIHFLLYALIGVVICFVVGYLSSFMTSPPKTEKTEGLTYLSRNKATR